MASPVMTMRVLPNSALERLLVGRQFTELVNRMAEIVEAAPDAVRAALPEAVRQPEPTRFVPKDQRVFTIGHDAHTAQVVTEAEVLAMAREQYPAGLVPVGVLDDEEDANSGYDEAETEALLTSPAIPTDEEDLSHLV